jgi:NADH dehydrogenase [ubiquinone] 1 alpha subcomplex assembly factor 6
MLAKLRSEGTLGHDFEHQHEEEHQYDLQVDGKEGKLAEVEKAFGVFMPSVATQSWLDRLQKADFDVFDQSLRGVDWKLPVKAYWAYSRRKI